MMKCPFCEEKIKEESLVCQFCGRDLQVSRSELKSIYYCPLCNTEDSYCDSTNRIFCPHCREYLKQHY